MYTHVAEQYSVRSRVFQSLYLFILALQCSLVSAQALEIAPRQVPEDEVLVLLKSGKYSDLSKKLQNIQGAYAADSSVEPKVHRTFYQFYRVDGNISRPLDRWIEAQPNNALAYLARGIYRTKLGWASRGGKFSWETTDMQFSGMAAWFNAAKEDLDRSVRLDPTIVEAYCYLIEIDVNEGGRLTPALYNQAISVKPDSFIAREYYLWSQLPRWGGSHSAMVETIADAKPFYGKTPQLAVLEGRIDADIGELAVHRDDYQTAIAHFKKALSKGDFWFSNQRYGEALAGIRDHNAAVEQYTRVIRDKPGYKRAWELRGRSYIHLGRYAEAIADLSYAISIEPRDDSVFAFRGMAYRFAGNIKAALADFRTAEKINPSDPTHAKQASFAQDMLNRTKAAQ